MKKLIIFTLLITLLSQMFIFPVLGAETETAPVDSTAQNAVAFMTQLGVLGEDFNGDTVVTKSGFVKLALDVTKTHLSDDLSQEFADVDETYYAFSEIMTAKKLGYVKGDGTPYFQPDKKVTITEATAVVMNILNYGYLYGTTSYSNIIRKNSLYDGISPDENGFLDYADCVTLLYNMLLANNNEVVGLDGDSLIYESFDGQTLLSTIYGIERFEGIVTSVGDLSLEGYTSASDDMAVIGGVHVKDANHDTFNLLGYNVEVFAKENGGKYELMQIKEIEGENDVVTVNAADISPESNQNEFVYYGSNDREKALRLSDNFTLVYNGKVYNGFDSKLFDIKTGHVKLVSSNGGRDYHVVYIDEYVNYKIKSVSVREEKIYLQDSSIVMDYGNSDEIKILNYKGETVPAEELYAGLVVSVCAAKNTPYYVVRVGQGTMVLTPNALDDEYIYMDDEKYKLSSDVLLRKNEFLLGEKVILHIDAYGEVADFEYRDEDISNYAYLVDIASTKKGLNSERKVKMFTEFGEMTVFTVEDELDLNGVTGDADTVLGKFIKAGVAEKQLVKYKATEDNVLKSLWTYTDITLSSDYTGYEYDDDNFSLDYKCESGSSYRYECIDTRYIVNAQTLYFIVPTGENASDDDYRCATGSSINDNTDVTAMEIYDANAGRLASVIVNEGGVVSDFSGYIAPLFVTRVSYAIDVFGDSGLKVEGYRSGKLAEFFFEDDNLADSGEWASAFAGIKASELQTGDVVQLVLSNATDKVKQMRILYRRNAPDAYDQKSNGSISAKSIYSWLYTTSAKVVEQNEDGCLIHTNRLAAADVAEQKRIVPFSSGAYIYVYDSETNTLTLTDKSEDMIDRNIFADVRLSGFENIVVYK